jgi:hypothetical protein
MLANRNMGKHAISGGDEKRNNLQKPPLRGVPEVNMKVKISIRHHVKQGRRGWETNFHRRVCHVKAESNCPGISRYSARARERLQ